MEKNKRKFALEVTERHMNIIIEATDLYQRLLDGHIEHALWNLFISRDIDHDRFSELCRSLKTLVYPDLAPNGYFTAGWKDGDSRLQKAQLGYEIQAMIRHELWKRDENAPRHTTSASEPLHCSTEELLQIKTKQELTFELLKAAIERLRRADGIGSNVEAVNILVEMILLSDKSGEITEGVRQNVGDDWNPVSRLPEDERKIIIYDGEVGMDYGGWFSREFGWLGSDGAPLKNATHWREMLEKPEELSDESETGN